jgi:archaellum component FlaC
VQFAEKYFGGVSLDGGSVSGERAAGPSPRAASILKAMALASKRRALQATVAGGNSSTTSPPPSSSPTSCTFEELLASLGDAEMYEAGFMDGPMLGTSSIADPSNYVISSPTLTSDSFPFDLSSDNEFLDELVENFHLDSSCSPRIRNGGGPHQTSGVREAGNPTVNGEQGTDTDEHNLIEDEEAEGEEDEDEHEHENEDEEDPYEHLHQPNSLVQNLTNRLGVKFYAGERDSTKAMGAAATTHSDPAGGDAYKPNVALLELEAALDLLSQPTLTIAEKLDILREKFGAVLQDDLHWRERLMEIIRVAREQRARREQAEIELDKANAIKHRLESLCRDLHAENRRIKMERNAASTGKVAVDMPSNVATASSCNSAISKLPPMPDFSIPTLPDRETLANEPAINLADRIITLADLFVTREEHFAMLLRLRDSEITNITERLTTTTEQLTKHTAALDVSNRRVAALSRSEGELKTQVRQYVEKFRQVEETLGKSNDLFGTFRAEMEQMGAKLARLERENTQLTSKCATLSRNIIEMADERTKQNAALEQIKGQKAKLEQLCRTLQTERNAALGKDANPMSAGGSPPIPAVPATNAPPSPGGQS